MPLEPDTLAFAVHDREPPALEVRVNFGIYAGREATPAEIDELGRQLLEKVGAVSIVSEDRHEIDTHSEASVYLVRIEVPAEALQVEPGSLEELAGRLIETAERWAGACIAERHVEVT
jgi:hypothetical protein